MNETELFARVQELLDARMDPLDDAEVIAGFDANPEWLPRLAGLRADAMVLATSAPIRSRDTGRRRWPWWVAVFGATAAAALLASQLATPTRHRAGRIVASSLTELRPRAHLAATFVVKDAVVSTPSMRLQTWQVRSERR